VGFGAEAVMVGKIGKLRIEFPGAEPDLLHVVVEDAAGPAAACFLLPLRVLILH
jgi:hypothetical protein